ncbi:hypothetical protein MMC17_002779 [Xylographa soralifera]|nr:hypothetical protein [Xylographa soralifera]
MDRIAPIEAIILLDYPIDLAMKVEELDDLDDLATNEALENMREPCQLPYSEYVELTSHPDTFASWISPFLSDSKCTRPAIALSIPYLDHTGPQPTSHETDDKTGGEYPRPHQSYNDELARFPEPRPYINYMLVQILYGLALDYGYLDRNDTGCYAYLQDGRDRYYKVHEDLQKTSRALQSVIIAAEMMEKGEKAIADQMEEPEKMHEVKATEAQATSRPESGGHISDNTVVCSNLSLSSDYLTSAPQPTSVRIIDTKASTPSAFIYEDPALGGKHNALDEQLLTNDSFYIRNLYEMSFYHWKLLKLVKRRDRVSQSLSALKQRFCEKELPLLLKIGKWYCKQEKKKRLSKEKLNTAEKDVETEEMEKDAEEEFTDEQMYGLETWDRDDEVLMDFETAAAQLDGDFEALDRVCRESNDMSSDLSELGVEGVL